MTTGSPARESLDTFHDPQSVTVMGASADPRKWGYWLATGALRGAARRTVHLVNRGGARINGYQSVPGLEDIEEPLDLVVLCVPPAAVPQAVEQALDRGARGFLCITAGIDRALGEPGAERRLAALIRSHGARLIGPNCLGIYDAATDLQLAWGDFLPGWLGIVSQSGQLGSELADRAADRGLGVSRFVSVGNQVDVEVVDALDQLVDHEQTRVVALYAESFRDGRSVIETLHRLREAGKHTIVLTVGASAASRAAAQSHSGALTSSIDVVDAACRAAGAVRVRTPNELIEVAHMLVAAPPPRGRRVAIVGDSGGQAAVAADIMVQHRLEVPPLAPDVQERLAELLPADAGLANPVDLAGAGEQDLGTYAVVIEELLAAPTIDAVTLTGYFGRYGSYTPSLIDPEGSVGRRIAEAAARHEKPVALHSMSRESSTLRLVHDLGVPTYPTIETAAAALGACADLAETPGRVLGPSHVPKPGETPSGYLGARELLAAAGVQFPPVVAIRDVEEARAAARRLRQPVVLKADWILHKTEHRAVRVGLAGPDEVVAAFEEMSSRLGPGHYVLEEMDTRPDVVEMIVGAHRDPAFGPIVLVGAGGTLAELYRDSAIELAPVTAATAARMRSRLHSDALLHGWRGRPATDTTHLDEIVAAVSRLVSDHPEIAEIEINPLRVGPDGAIAVDALITPTTEHEEDPDDPEPWR